MKEKYALLIWVSNHFVGQMAAKDPIPDVRTQIDRIYVSMAKTGLTFLDNCQFKEFTIVEGM